MADAFTRYVGLLVDRICELSIENELLRKMLDSADILEVRANWKKHLESALTSPEAHQKRAHFAQKRDEVLKNLHREEAVEAMLKLPTKGLPN